MKMNKMMILTSLLVFSACSKNNVENNYHGLTSEKNSQEKPIVNSDGGVELTPVNNFSKSNFLIQQGALPLKKSVDYFSVVEKTNEENKRIVLVDGLIVRIASDSQTDININQNLSRVEINAEELIIEKPLHFPGADVVINVKKLIFKNNGVLSIVPNKVLGRAELTKDGKKGLNAGSIILNVSEIDFGEKKVRFDLSGGDGQDAGLGIPGKAGKSVADFGDGVVGKCVTTIFSCHEREVGPIEVRRVGPVCDTQVPSNGEMGSVAGAPGAGGDGGKLIIQDQSLVSDEFIKKSPGLEGAIAPKTLGGFSGNPKVFYESYSVENKSTGFCSKSGGGAGGLNPKNYSGFIGKVKIGEVINGQDLESPQQAKEMAFSGKVEINQGLTFVHSAKLLDHRLSYAKDLYRNNFFEKALDELSQIEKLSNKNTDAVSMLVNKDSSQLLNQLNSHKDIDGLGINHVPVLSLPKIFSAYKREIDSSFETLKFTSRFLRNVYSVEKKSEKLLEKKTSLSEEVVVLHQQNQKAYGQLTDVMRLSSEVESSKLAFDEALRKLEKEIENEAQRNIHSREKKKKLLGAIRLVANLAKVFPAGQPAVGAIGTGIDSIVAMSEKEDSSWQDRLQEGYEIYGDLRNSLGSEKWQESKDHWNKEYRSLFYEKFKDQNPKIEKNRFEAYLKETVNKAKPLVKEVNKYYKDVLSKQVPRSEYEAEVQKIKEQHAGFQFVITKLNELQGKKEELDNVLNKNMAIINSTESEIYRMFIAMEAAETERLNLIDRLNFDVNDSLKIINERAKRRLKDYKRLLIKAYNYRLIVPFKGSYDLEKLEEQFVLFSKSNGETIDIDLLKNLYFEDLSQVANGILESLDSGLLREYEASVSYELNTKEIEAINSGRKIFFNPMAKGLLQDDEENLRVESIVVEGLEALLTDDRKVLDISFEQVGDVEIERFGKLYVFKPNENGALWKTRYEPLSDNLSAISESKSLGTLFDVLFSNGGSSSELYAKPALRGNYLIKTSDNLKELKRLRLVIKYTYSVKK